MATFNLNGYNSYSGCDIIVTARLNNITGGNGASKEKVYSLGSIQTLSISTHQDKRSVRNIGSVNAIDYTMGQRTIAGSLVFAVFDQHFATEMFNDLEKITGKTFFLPDELPALDLTITFANEYGRTSRMAIYGLRIINEGQVMSVNDLYTENTYQFVANSMEPLKKGTQTGSSSDKNNDIQIAPASNFEDDNSNYDDEDIYDKPFIEDSNDLKRVLLSVNIEQPTYENQDGIANFTLSPNKSSGLIIIYNQIQDKLETELFVYNENNGRYTTTLKQGVYSAWYEDNGQSLSNTVIFTIDRVGNYNFNNDDSPIIEDISKNHIQIYSNNAAHSTAVCINSLLNKVQEIELKSRRCTFKNLDANSLYTIYTKHEKSNSNITNCKTLNNNEDYLKSFKNYVVNNKNLLSSDIENYEDILNKLNDNQDIIYTLSKINNIKSKEIIYMAIKYKNEFTKIINSNKLDNIPIKNLDNIFGNTFKFNSGVLKCNIFSVKNKREYFVHSEQYPIEITFENGLSNMVYSAVSITNEHIKSPKYTFYNYNSNDKTKIESLYGNANILNNIDLSNYYMKNKKYSDKVLKCLAVIDNKNIDIKLLKAPYVSVDKYNNLLLDVNYKDHLGIREKEYYICISNIEESLDSTPFRKILFKDNNNSLFVNQFLTAMDSINTFVIWIEDENYNVISEMAFISKDEEISEFNLMLIEKETEKILNQLSAFSVKNNINDYIHSIAANNPAIKNIYYELAKMFIDKDISNKETNLFELFKIKFNDFYINQDKYRKVIINKNNKKIEFDTFNINSSQLVYIKLKQNYDYSIEVIDNNYIYIDEEYDYHLLYLIDSNPIIKSGFILIDNKLNINTHGINLEEVT